MLEKDTNLGPAEWGPCDCGGCWACTGYVDGCTCDIDWDAVYGWSS